MHSLYLLYDGRCELCCRLKSWLQEQEAWVELKMVPAGSAQAREMFPGLEAIASSDDLVAISDEGEVYLNNRAWIMCLYALVDYRDWARRLAHPALLPLARQAFEVISRNRYLISRWLRGSSPERMAEELRQITLKPCSVPEPRISDYLR